MLQLARPRIKPYASHTFGKKNLLYLCVHGPVSTQRFNLRQPPLVYPPLFLTSMGGIILLIRSRILFEVNRTPAVRGQSKPFFATANLLLSERHKIFSAHLPHTRALQHSRQLHARTHTLQSIANAPDLVQLHKRTRKCQYPAGALPGFSVTCKCKRLFPLTNHHHR